MIEGAKPGDLPGFIKPQLAKLADEAPAGDGWLHEIKFDGYRLQPHVRSGRVITYTRGGLDWTTRFSAIVDAIGARARGFASEVPAVPAQTRAAGG